MVLPLIFSLLLSSVFASQSNPQCIGRGDNPSSDFYIQNLKEHQNKVSTAMNRIPEAKQRIEQINQEVQRARNHQIPALQENISRQRRGIQEQINQGRQAVNTHMQNWNEERRLDLRRERIDWGREINKRMNESAEVRGNQDLQRQLMEDYHRGLEDLDKRDQASEQEERRRVTEVIRRRIDQSRLFLNEMVQGLKDKEAEMESLLGEKSDLEKELVEINDYLNRNSFMREWMDLKKSRSELGDQHTEGGLCVECVEPIASRSDFLSRMTELAAQESKKAPLLKKECIIASLSNRETSTNEVACASANSDPESIDSPCINDEIVDYIHFSINKALDCLSDPEDPVNPDILFQKINNESIFRPSFSYNGGRGLMQMTNCAKAEMLGLSPSPACEKNIAQGNIRSGGRRFLARHLSERAKTNPSCEAYSSIINYEAETQYDLMPVVLSHEDYREIRPECYTRAGRIRKRCDKDYKDLAENYGVDRSNHRAQHPEVVQSISNHENRCADISLDEGMQRNILTGIGLYLYYRDEASNSATALLSGNGRGEFGLNKENNSQFNEMRDYLTLGMYGPDGIRGFQRRLRSMNSRIKNNVKDGKIDIEDFKKLLLEMGGSRNYFAETERSLRQVFPQGEDWSCSE